MASPSQRRKQTTTDAEADPAPKKKKVTRKKSAARKTRSNFDQLEDQIVERVIVPGVCALIVEGEYMSLEDAFDDYRAENKVDFSDERLYEMMEKVGVKPRLVIPDIDQPRPVAPLPPSVDASELMELIDDEEDEGYPPIRPMQPAARPSPSVRPPSVGRGPTPGLVAGANGGYVDGVDANAFLH